MNTLDRINKTDKRVYAMINFAYFTVNFSYDFIDSCWNDDDNLRNHLKSKLVGKADSDGFINCCGFMKFFFDLDRTNQKKLVNWVNDNYIGINE